MNVFKKSFNAIEDYFRPECNRCNERCLFDFSTTLLELKKVGEYKQEFEQYERLCGSCWNELVTFPCDSCKTDFIVTKDKKQDLIEHLKSFNVTIPTIISSAKHICPKCFKKNTYTECSCCNQAFLLADNKAIDYTSDSKFEEMLSPYSEFYQTISWLNDKLCPNCYDKVNKACVDVNNLMRNWIAGTKYEYIRGYKTVKTLGFVEYVGDACRNPAAVEKMLKRYSAQLGGNGFVKYYWEKNEESVVAGYSHNNNPYYKTNHTFTGYATAVFVEPNK